MPECPVCLSDIQADNIAFQFHVNDHFTQSENLEVEAPEVARLDYSSHIDKGLKVNEGNVDDTTECIICGYPFEFLTAKEREDHVNNCLDSQEQDPFEDAQDDDEGSVTLYERSDWGVRHEHALQPSAQSIKGVERNGSVHSGWEGPAKPGGWADWVSRKVSTGDKWWDPITGSTDEGDIPPNYSPGAMEALRQYLVTATKSSTQSAKLSLDVPHIRHSLRFDIGWGCGYRNALMAISALIVHSPAYRRVFARESNGSDPGVRRIQGWIEEAWEAGFDREGCMQLKGKILGTRKWIGPTELHAMFSFKGIPKGVNWVRAMVEDRRLTIVDFPKANATDADKSSRPAYRRLVEWVKDYFDESQSVLSHSQVGQTAFDVLMQSSADGQGAIRQTAKFPLILQHPGHSRLIVGYERTTKGINLLLFDPGFNLRKETRQIGIRYTHQRMQNRPVPTPPRKPSNNSSNSHESLNFQRPYTNGASEVYHFPSQDTIGSGERKEVVLADDEEMTAGGWVKKKMTQMKKRKKGDMEVESDNTENREEGGSRKEGEGGESKKDVARLLADFRVPEEKLSKWDEFSILLFPGGDVLSLEERERRKVLTSIRVV